MIKQDFSFFAFIHISSFAWNKVLIYIEHFFRYSTYTPTTSDDKKDAAESLAKYLRDNQYRYMSDCGELVMIVISRDDRQVNFLLILASYTMVNISFFFYQQKYRAEILRVAWQATYLLIPYCGYCIWNYFFHNDNKSRITCLTLFRKTLPSCVVDDFLLRF